MFQDKHLLKGVNVACVNVRTPLSIMSITKLLSFILVFHQCCTILLNFRNGIACQPFNIFLSFLNLKICLPFFISFNYYCLLFCCVKFQAFDFFYNFKCFFFVLQVFNFK
jgi:hypothetical protein